jgi:hypothetical protein
VSGPTDCRACGAPSSACALRLIEEGHECCLACDHTPQDVTLATLLAEAALR